MRKFPRNVFAFVCLTVSALVLMAVQSHAQNPEDASAQRTLASFAEAPDHSMEGMEGMQGMHQDHYPKHGGTFFMAMDNKHHLEGTFVAPGIFRVYLYDAYTKPLPPNKVKQAKGSVQLGDSPDAPKLPLVLSKDGKTLEINLGKDVKLPITLTLWMHFPDTPPDAKPELFTFPFSHYAGDGSQQNSMHRASHSEHQM